MKERKKESRGGELQRRGPKILWLGHNAIKHSLMQFLPNKIWLGWAGTLV